MSDTAESASARTGVRGADRRLPVDVVGIGNERGLAGHGLRRLREQVLRIAIAGLASAQPGTAVAEAVRLEGDDLLVDGHRHRLGGGGGIVVLGAGKASVAIAAALDGTLGERLSGGLVVAKEAHTGLKRVESLVADHPLPSARSAAAGRRLLELAGGLEADDLALCCFTGGSSALSAVPPAGVSIEEKRELHALLLASGMPIAEMNAVRKHVSDSKGGRIAELAAPATVINLTVSDVAHHPLDAITDPSVPDTTTAADAVAVLRDYELWERVAPSVRRHLETPAAESPDLSAVQIQSVVLASGRTVCDAMTLEATSLGLRPIVLSTTLEGEARWIGTFVSDLARASFTRGVPFAPPCVLLGCGGEGTVELDDGGGVFGLGGPNQEASLAAAAALAGAQVAALFIDTDGSDGGTEIAGGIVDGTSAARAVEAGADLRAALLAHRSSEPLEKLGDAVRTGATNTNVNDLFVVAIAGELA
jgi:glycerate 2-kinase